MIGVHTPEFSFEHDLDNVRQQTREIGVDYPSAIDSDFVVWRAFHNQYWPALYVFDAQGRLRHHQFGEGGYAETDAVIQKLLEEAGRKDVDSRTTQVTAGDSSSLPTGTTCVPPRPTWERPRPRASPLPAASTPASGGPIPARNG